MEVHETRPDSTAARVFRCWLPPGGQTSQTPRKKLCWAAIGSLTARYGHLNCVESLAVSQVGGKPKTLGARFWKQAAEFEIWRSATARPPTVVRRSEACVERRDESAGGADRLPRR